MRLIPTVKTIILDKPLTPMTDEELKASMARIEADFMERFEREGFGAMFDITPVEES